MGKSRFHLKKYFQLRILLRKIFKDAEVLLPVIHNSAWLFLDKFLRLGLGVIIGAWVARYLGPAQYGELAFVIAYIAIFQAIANLGLDGIVVRDISQHKSRAHTLLGTTFVLRLGVGILCWVGAVLAMAWANGLHDLSVKLTILVGSILVLQAADTVDLWFQSQSQSKRTTIAKFSAYLVSNGIKVVLILIKAPIEAFAVVIALEGIIAAIGLSVAYKKFPCDNKWGEVRNLAFDLIKESWPFIIGGVSIMVYMRVDQIMIKEMLGVRQLGIYAAVLPLATLWQVIPVVLNLSLAPYIARKKIESEAAYWWALERIFKAYSFIGWLICIPTLLFGGWAIQLLYGADYQEGAMVLSIYVFTNLFINMGMAQGLWMLNERKPLISLFNTLVGAIVCIAGNYFIIPLFGISGVAFVAVLSQLSSTVLTNIIFSRRIFFMQINSLITPRLKF